MSNPRKKIDKYIVHLDKKLGVGSFGTVYIGFHIDTKDKVAIKMLDKKTSKPFITQSKKTNT